MCLAPSENVLRYFPVMMNDTELQNSMLSASAHSFTFIFIPREREWGNE